MNFQLPKIAVIFSLSILFFVAQPKSHAQSAVIVAEVDLSEQRMRVYINGKQEYVWRVSTGKKGWPTPIGSFRPYKTHRNYYEKYWNANLPYLVAVYRGVAIHGTNATQKLGRPASHGCIRLSISNASRFYDLVKKHGLRKTRVVITP